MRAYTPSHPQLHNSILFIRWLLSSSSRPQLFSYGSSLQPEVSLRGADWPQPKASTVKRLFDSYLWFCVCSIKKNLQHCASMHRDFFHILVVYLHKTHRNVVTFYPSLRFWSVYPPSKCKKVFCILPFALFCLIFFYFFPTAYLTLTSALPRLTKNTCLLCFQQAGR